MCIPAEVLACWFLELNHTDANSEAVEPARAITNITNISVDINNDISCYCTVKTIEMLQLRPFRNYN